jgi:hypothetical protein
MAGGGKAGDVADLGAEDGGHDRAYAGDRLDGVIAGVVFEHAAHLALDHGQFPVEQLEEVPQGFHPQGVHPFEGHLVDEHLAAGAEHVVQLGQVAVLGHHRVDLSLRRRPKHGQLGPVADDLSHFTHRRRGDPTLGQIVLAQPVRQRGRVADVVLDPPAVPVQT